MVFKIMKNKSVRTEIQKSFLWNFKLYAFIGCLAFPLNVLGESVSFDTDNVAFMSPSQRIKVTGIVKDEAGITLPGVNVVVKGTIIGTITDANGQFTLEAPSDGVLLFTYVGFGNLELPVNGNENLEIIMSLWKCKENIMHCIMRKYRFAIRGNFVIIYKYYKRRIVAIINI